MSRGCDYARLGCPNAPAKKKECTHIRWEGNGNCGDIHRLYFNMYILLLAFVSDFI
jgi:hypothetical protein